MSSQVWYHSAVFTILKKTGCLASMSWNLALGSFEYSPLFFAAWRLLAHIAPTVNASPFLCGIPNSVLKQIFSYYRQLRRNLNTLRRHENPNSSIQQSWSTSTRATIQLQASPS